MEEKLFLDELLGELHPEDATDKPIEIDDSDIMGFK